MKAALGGPFPTRQDRDRSRGGGLLSTPLSETEASSVVPGLAGELVENKGSGHIWAAACRPDRGPSKNSGEERAMRPAKKAAGEGKGAEAGS